jgi:KaiC/GvpD/RAD55 family RecA-like ATPase
MVKSELIKRSPLRIFEKSIHGGVGSGHIGVIASKKGVGKTACLTHIAVDKLFQDRKVIHVSFAANVDHIVAWYEDIFHEIAKKRELEHAVEVHDDIVKNRVIMNFNQEGVDTAQILQSLEALIEDGNFQADSVIFDGYTVSNAAGEDLQKIKDFAKKLDLEIWFSISLSDDKENPFNDQNIPEILEGVLEKIDVIINLKHEGDYIHLEVAKDHEMIEAKDMALRLDPKTLLIAEE